MSAKDSIARLAKMFACACMALALVAGAAQAVEPHPHVGKLPGYPAMRGVVPVLGSSAAVAAHEKVVSEALAAAGRRFSTGSKGTTNAEPNTKFVARCVEEERFLASQDVCYRGGPVLHGPTVHLIFWQGPVTTNVDPFPPGYITTVERYFEGIAHDSGLTTDTFAVDAQYGEEPTPGTYRPGEYKLAFNRAEDVTVDKKEPFKPGCVDKASAGPCLLDAEIQKEVATVAKTSEKGLNDVYVVLTPPGVGGCFESGACAYEQYCAYHGDFGGDGVTPGKQTLYADIPFVGEVPGCDFGVHPNSLTDDGTDAAIDDASHEVNEVITDPIGSQCETGAKSVLQCERNARTDVIGQEIADKCLPPESTFLGTYGEPLGLLDPPDETSAYNQVIDGHPYWTQRVWSNEAGLGEGGCIQRVIGASFNVSAGAAASVPIVFNGGASGAPGDPAVYWVWNFEGEQVGTPSVTTSHTYPAPGTYEVGLTAYDAYGNSQATVESVSVGAAPVPPQPAPTPPVVKEASAAPVVRLTATQLATTLGLPAPGKSLSGSTQVLLGRAACPPACAIVARLYAKVTITVHGRRSTKLVSIGSARLNVAVKGVGVLTLQLSASGRALLHKLHRLSCQLRMTVEGQEGGSWQIVRSLTLTR